MWEADRSVTYLSIINYMSFVVQNMSPLYCWDDSYIDST